MKRILFAILPLLLAANATTDNIQRPKRDGGAIVLQSTTSGGVATDSFTMSPVGTISLLNGLVVNNGTYSSPSLSFVGDPNSGIYHTGTADEIAITAGGVPKIIFKSSGISLSAETSGELTVRPSATTTSYTLQFPPAQGADNSTLVNGGSGTLLWESPIIAIYKVASTQTIETGGSGEIIQFDTKIQDSGHTSDVVTTGASWRFTAPRTAVYQVSVNAYVDSITAWDAGEQMQLILKKDGTDVGMMAKWIAYANINQSHCINASFALPLTSGQYISMAMYQSSGGNLYLANGEYSRISIVEVR